MCGRYAIECEEENIELKEIIEEIGRRYAGKPELAFLKTGEIFPTEIVPILASEDARPLLMRWGMPRWDGKGAIINARCETAMEKKMFRPNLLARRCVVPSTGFYEWSHKEVRQPTLFDFEESKESSFSAANGAESGKGKYLLRIPDAPMLYMAGFYTAEARIGEAPPPFVILTTAANEWVAPLHSRMPLILEKKNVLSWLTDSRAAASLLSRPCTARLSAELK